MNTTRRGWLIVLAILLCMPGCRDDSANTVVVYTALDQPFSEPILKEFEHRTGTRVAAKYDVEATKTVGLAEAIRAERQRPRCDVFWNNEILNTLRLDREGLLRPFYPSQAEHFPEAFRSSQGTWYGFAARARVLIVNKGVAEDEAPTSIFDLADPKWKGQTAIAKPLFGTTATHAACLFAHLGDDEARGFFRRLKENDVLVLEGNKQVAQAVSTGEIAFGLTDTDDAIVQIERGSPVWIVYPDQGPDQIGTLFIPNTIAIVEGCPHPEAAEQLADYLLSKEVETRLAGGPSAQIPLHDECDVHVRVKTPREIKAMPIDFEQAVEHWDTAAEFLRKEFLQ
ncbi:extracellular solute-binding protein [Thermostilla marina]